MGTRVPDASGKSMETVSGSTSYMASDDDFTAGADDCAVGSFNGVNPDASGDVVYDLTAKY